MKKINQLLLATCIFAISNIASAAIITGTINFSSETNAFWTPVDGAWNSTTLAASTGMAFTAGDNGFDQNITGGTGTFTGMENTGVDFKDFQFDPLAAGTPLWEFDFGVTTYTFTMNTVSFLSKGGSTILLEGTGYMSDGIDITFGTWDFSGNTGSFSASSAPEPTLILLLATGLIGFGFARRARKAA